MALSASVIWEMRVTGSNNNSGGFDSSISGAGTDYSLQDAAQLALTDLACTTGGTTLTSATGGFTSAMIGNIIYIRSGTHFTAGFYAITARTDTNTVTLDRDPTDGTNGTGGSGNVGGARAQPVTAFTAGLVAGNKVWIKSGTYTFAASVTAGTAGTSTAYITWEGYKTTRGDHPTETDRPYWSQGAYTFNFAAYYMARYIRAMGTAANVWASGNSIYSYCRECKVDNQSGTADRSACNFGTYASFLKCEVLASAGRGISGSAGLNVIACNIHGFGTYGIYSGGTSGVMVYNNTIWQASVAGTGIHHAGTSQRVMIFQNSIYGCTTGIDLQATTAHIVANNIISGCTTGVSISAADITVYMQYNVMNNTTNYNNVTAGATDIIGDPLFVDPTSGNLMIAATSPALNAGAVVDSRVGMTTVSYKQNIGTDQNDHVEGSYTWVG